MRVSDDDSQTPEGKGPRDSKPRSPFDDSRLDSLTDTSLDGTSFGDSLDGTPERTSSIETSIDRERTPGPKAADIHVGEIIDVHHIVSVLGEGGMGRGVFEARHLDTGALYKQRRSKSRGYGIRSVGKVFS